MLLGLHHLGIDVADLDRSAAFYEALGFTKERTLDGQGGMRIVFLTLGGLHLELFSRPDFIPACREEGTCGFRHISLTTDDLGAEVASLREKGIVGEDPRVITLQHGARFIELRDPDGVGVTVMQD